jgi:hypothetical protein
MAKSKSRKKNRPGADGRAGERESPEALMRDLFERMEAEKTAEALNDNVIIPFAAALEEICRARGYVLNIYGEASNIVFAGDGKDAEAIYRLVEEYLAAKKPEA